MKQLKLSELYQTTYRQGITFNVDEQGFLKDGTQPLSFYTTVL